MKIKNNEDDIAHLAAIVLVAVIAVIGFVGWRIWESSGKKSAKSDNPVIAEPNTPAVVSGSEKKNVIILPKMNIQFNVPDSLKSLSYVESMSAADPSVKTGFGSDEYPLASIVLPSLETPECKLPENAGGYLGVAWKVSGQYPSEANASNSAGVLVKQFPRYYIGYKVPSMDCANDTTQQAKISSIQKELETALRSATEIN